MKHLRRFNEGLERKEILQDLKEICLDLTDDGFNVKFFSTRINHVEFRKLFGGSSDFGLIITLPKSIDQTHDFKYKKVSEVIERIKRYMKINKYKTYVTKCRQSRHRLRLLNINIPNPNVFQVAVGFELEWLEPWIDSVLKN